MTTDICTADRQLVLRFAGRLTTNSGDAVAVAVNAGPLLAWAEDASHAADAETRIRALSQHFANCAFAVTDDAVQIAADNPAEFLRGAKILYAFATAWRCVMTAAAWSEGAAGPVLRLADEADSYDWRDGALCSQVDPDFVRGRPRKPEGRKACLQGLPIKAERLEDALEMEARPR